MELEESSVSAVICTHNPRHDYLCLVLAGLRQQTLPQNQWELIIIDNASDQRVADRFDVSWHKHGRHVREERLGLTAARLRGIAESSGDLIVFVDDDNVLDDDYLQAAVELSERWPMLGAWGGAIRPEFEVPPPTWIRLYRGALALRDFSHDRWSNLPHQHETTPCGAGLIVRRAVAEAYAENITTNSARASMDRIGNVLTSCGDSDLAFTACDLGLGTGQMTALRLTHLIPKTRLEEQYLLQLVEGIAYSHVWLNWFRGIWHDAATARWQHLRGLLRSLFLNRRARRHYLAAMRGRTRGARDLNRMRNRQRTALRNSQDLTVKVASIASGRKAQRTETAAAENRGARTTGAGRALPAGRHIS